MAVYEFPKTDEIEDHVPEDEEIERIEYHGDTERVYTSEEEGPSDDGEGSSEYIEEGTSSEESEQDDAEVEEETEEIEEELEDINDVDLDELNRNELRQYAKNYDDVDGNSDEETLREQLSEKQE